MANGFTWQWRLANGGVVTGTLENDLETVTQDAQVLSQCRRGDRPDGHVVVVSPPRASSTSDRPPIEATLSFATHAPICILRVEGQEVAPIVWPTRTRQAAASSSPKRAFPGYLAGGAAVGIVLGFALAFRSLHGDAATARFDGTYRAPNGLFVAHYPTDLSPSPALLPQGASGIVLENKDQSTVVVLASMSGVSDGWKAQQLLHDEALANLPKSTATVRETGRSEETCASEHGAVVTGTLEGPKRGRVWSCGFVHDGAGYLALTMLVEPTSAIEDKRAKAIVDALELTKLGELAH